MRVQLTAALVIGVSTCAYGAHFYESFDYPTGNLGLNVNPNGQTWFSSAANPAGTDNDRVQVASGNLILPPGFFPAESGNMANFGGGGRTDRIYLGTNRSSGDVFYSLLMKVVDLTGTGASGVTIFGFNNTAQTPTGTFGHDTAAQPSSISGRLTIKPGTTAGTYVLGGAKASGTVGDWAWADGKPVNVGDTVFVVGRYSFDAAGHFFDLWVNPDPSTFRDNSLIPTPDAHATAGGNGGQIATIILRQFGTTLPTEMLFDEISVDTSWAGVTPEPTSLGLLMMGGMMLLRRSRR